MTAAVFIILGLLLLSCMAYWVRELIREFKVKPRPNFKLVGCLVGMIAILALFVCASGLAAFVEIIG